MAEILKKSSHDVTTCKPYKIEEDQHVHVPFIWTTTMPTTRTTISITTSKYSSIESIEKDEEMDDKVETTDTMISESEENEKILPCTNEGKNFFSFIIHFESNTFFRIFYFL